MKSPTARQLLQMRAAVTPRLFDSKIESKQEAREFLMILVLLEWMWHPDDDPQDVVDPPWGSEFVTFLRKSMEETREQLNDPCEVILEFRRILYGR